MDQALFLQGESIEDYIAGLTDNRAKFEQLLAESQLREDQLSLVEGLPVDLRVLVIAEPWSGDVLYNLPPLLRIAQGAGWEVRIFRRDKYPDMILPYRKDGLYQSIPVFVFFDRDFNELGSWIERPVAATRMIDEESLKLRRRLREEHKDDWRLATLREIVDLLKSPD